MPGYWFHVESVVSHLQEPYELSMDFQSRWLTGHLAYEIEPLQDGSILHHRETVRVPAFLRRLAPFIARRLRRRITERLADIKEILEATS